MGTKPSNPEIEQQIQACMAFLDTQPDGAELSWADLSINTGLPMDVRGPQRQYVRRALKRLKRPYEALHGDGIRLSTPATALTILRGKWGRVDGALRAVERTNRQLQTRHLDQMTGEEQRKLLMAGAFFGAVRAYAAQGRQHWGR